MIGVNMGVDHVEDPQAAGFRRRQVRRDVADRVDDGAGGLAAAAEEIGRGDRLGVKELAQDHPFDLLGQLGAVAPKQWLQA